MQDISVILAFSAGFLSFLSPCVLPMVPAYISYLTGTSIEELKQNKTNLNTLYKSSGFVIGFSIIFILMGLSITSLGSLFNTNKELFQKIGGIFIIIFGLHTLGLFKIKLFAKEKRLVNYNETKGYLSSIIMGMAFATGWTPCIGPILSSILIYASSESSISKGVFLLVIYSIGLGIPFLFTGIMIKSFIKYFKKFSRFLPIVTILSGILLLLMGLLIFTNNLSIISQYLNFINFNY